jgi:hypothetical protein
MTFLERRGAIAKLPVPAQVAFAARCGERALAEARLLRPDLVAAYPALSKGVDLVWRHAIQQDVDFQRDVMAIHAATSKLIPESEDEVVPDQAIRFAGQAISLGLSISLVPDKSAKYSASAGGAMINLVGCVYEKADEVQKLEGAWQDRAVEFLTANRDKPISRSVFNELPEYERGPVSESYKKGYEG